MKTKRYMSLDIMKGIAMIMVILVHYNQSFQNNIELFKFCQMGCQIFFVISGLGVAFSLSKRLDQHNLKSDLISYYKSRITRIAPAYYFMMVVIFLINTVVLHFANRTLQFGTNRSYFSILCNVLFIHGLIPPANNTVMPGGWYIGTTMLLYFVAPFLYLIFQRYSKHRRLICIITSIVSVTMLFILTLIIPNQYKHNLVNNNSFGYFSILTQLPCFALGMLLYFEIQKNSKGSIILNMAVGFVIMACSVILFFKPFFDFSYIVTASMVGVATFFIAKGLISIEEKGLKYSYPCITRIGQKSYFVYLTHAFFAWTFVFAIKRAFPIIGLQADNYLVYVLLFPIVVVLSYFSGVILEKVVGIIMNLFQKRIQKGNS